MALLYIYNQAFKCYLSERIGPGTSETVVAFQFEEDSVFVQIPAIDGYIILTDIDPPVVS